MRHDITERSLQPSLSGTLAPLARTSLQFQILCFDHTSTQCSAFRTVSAELEQLQAAAMAGLQLQPQELKFRFELRKTIPVTLSLSNTGDEPIAFKVKTTSPKKYCVRPSSGVVEPSSTKDVQVIMQAQREYPPSLDDVKDKFLVQYTTAPKGTREVGPDTFDPASNKDIRQTKLRVVLVRLPFRLPEVVLC